MIFFQSLKSVIKANCNWSLDKRFHLNVQPFPVFTMDDGSRSHDKECRFNFLYHVPTMYLLCKNLRYLCALCSKQFWFRQALIIFGCYFRSFLVVYQTKALLSITSILIIYLQKFLRFDNHTTRAKYLVSNIVNCSS